MSREDDPTPWFDVREFERLTSGYVAPLLFAATATDGLKSVMALREKSQWVNPTSGFLLVAGGTYAFLSRVVPHAAA